MIGKTISHYKILEKLGEGGMGIVYKAQDIKLDRYVALKFLPPHLTTSGEEKQRFTHEAKAASALQHNNICTIHEIDETEPAPGEPGGQIFICMDNYEGETLNKKIKEKPLPREEAIDIAIQITLAILLVFILVVTGYFFIYQQDKNEITDFGTSKWENSIAVLLFTDMSPEKDQEHFCYGMTEQIISNLYKLSQLKVITVYEYIYYLISFKRIKEAEKLISPWQDKRPEDNQLHLVRAFSYAARGDKENALSSFNKILFYDEEDKASFNLAIVYLLLNDQEKAIELIIEGEKYRSGRDIRPSNYFRYLNIPYFKILHNDSRFQEILAKQKELYEENLRKYGDID